MILRVQTRSGTSRVNDIIPSWSLLQLKQHFQKLESVGAPPDRQVLFLRSGMKTQQLEDDDTTLKSYNIQNGDIIIVQHLDPAPMVIDDTSEEIEVIEDEIDQILHEEDGWTDTGRTRYCQHRDNAKCNRCMPIAPWAVQNHDPWKSKGLKHIPFHSWVRELGYQSSNTVPALSEPTYKIKKEGETKVNSVTITRQPYRHVDHVQFENRNIIDKFVSGWRESGKQRCGVLYGRYEKENSIPLGIRATVSALYEPPQKSFTSRTVLLKDNRAEIVDEVAQKLGLRKIGFTWTAITVDQETKEIIEDRPADSPLTSKEMVRMSLLQSRNPSPWEHSHSGTFGSKFVSVLLSGKDGGIDLEAYQTSNQCVSLVSEGAVRASKEDPELFRVRKDTDEYTFADLLYAGKDEYGNNVIHRAEPYFPAHYFLISLTHGFAIESDSMFKSYDFPAVRNKTRPQWEKVRDQVSGKSGSRFLEASILMNILLLIYYMLEKMNMETTLYIVQSLISLLTTF
eukprot:TRINITY_DN724_c0_g1_i1.p1 TRINITY_DN724_c0_g1~~TRINITY_DN724_c0_g1_i1.p1  ORF type:complete len:510 (+),score=106.40 TRINITY_DN724_c0_g1_i1:366-1895(+)